MRMRLVDTPVPFQFKDTVTKAWYVMTHEGVYWALVFQVIAGGERVRTVCWSKQNQGPMERNFDSVQQAFEAVQLLASDGIIEPKLRIAGTA